MSKLTDEELRLLYECTTRATPVSRELRIRGVEELRATREVIAGFVRDCQASPTTALVAKELTNRLEAALEAKGGDK